MSYQQMIKNIKKNKQKGALLIEVVLATFIITTGLLAVMQLITGSLKDSFLNRDAIIATGLSQEGAELVRNIRDNSFINTTPVNPFEKFTGGARFCYVSYNFSASTILCDNGFVSNHHILSLNGAKRYLHGAGTTTKFSRMLYINYVVATEQATVKSIVWWGTIPTGVSSGSTTNCTVANKCVFTDVVLTKWK